MDHKLIDQALNTLLATKAADRTAEQIQGFAQLVCSAAGISFGSPTPALAGLPVLHAAASLLAAELDTAALNPHSLVSTTISFHGASTPTMVAHIHNKHGFGNGETILSGYGNSPEQVLQDLRNKAYDLCKQVAA
ncbi:MULTISPECIES: hypothetical protein [unclassified Pseudomonas]|uniref:hypothetical protein n=1 Tax=unclassified Pseudomonas TaxID=196821 RepID=UPI000839AFB4|nr:MULTISPECIES: hypothetical protein [unclassified Pseudomonas]QIH09288.1 hypothetical protein ATY02_22550 [Pseudomonas sp. BIOMIG1BAC]